MTELNKDEQDLFESVERGEWRSVRNLDEEIKAAKECAKSTRVKDQRMNIRISKKDLNALKVKALEEGIPYQTLVSSVIHKYLSGQLVEQ